MGGCKCSFQDCKTSTSKNAGMSFFHFPVRDPERCSKWAHYSNNLSFLQLPEKVLRNKVICEKHFRMECFMNYKKERLTKWAVPTVIELPNGQLVNLVKDDKLKEIYDIEGVHGKSDKLLILNQISPAKFDHINEEHQLLNEKSAEHLSEEEIEDYGKERTLSIEAVENCEVAESTQPLLLNSRSLKRQNSDNFIVTEIEIPPQRKKGKKSKINQNIVEITSANESRQIFESVNISSKNSDDDYTEIIYETDGLQLPPENIHSEDHEQTEISMQEAIQQNETHERIQNIFEIITKIQEEQNQNNQRIDEVVQLNKEQHSETIKKIDDFEKTHFDIRDKLEEMNNSMAQSQQKQQQHQIVDGQKTIYIDRNPSINKSLLFNGIKKYLNPSMVALLRMEMFGGPERQYKPDEKSLAMELFKFNDAFEYMRDELRFRLPPKTDVEKWIKEREELGTQVDWDDC